MTKEQKEAIEYLKIRLYGNEGCKCIDVAQEDLRIFINLVDCLQKENEELKNDYENLNNSVVVKNHCIKNSIPIQKIKDKIEEYKNMLKTCNKVKDIDRIKAINERILELQELLEGRK
jgi:hypothetical protein|nr:MAG TPA: hypothetical protein [Caudoviricetes sp.]